MTQKVKNDIDSQILYILEKIRDEYLVIEKQGFPAHNKSYNSSYSRGYDTQISESRWHSWVNELDIDFVRLEAILKIIQSNGLLEKFQFISEYE